MKVHILITKVLSHDPLTLAILFCIILITFECSMKIIHVEVRELMGKILCNISQIPPKAVTRVVMELDIDFSYMF